MKIRTNPLISVALRALVLLAVAASPSCYGEPARSQALAAPIAGADGRGAAPEQASGCQVYRGATPFPGAAYGFVKSLVHPSSGLVRSREGECFTTVYKNALAAMAFAHEGDMADAERILNVYRGALTTPFPGFPQVWDACSGQPDAGSDYWEGDNAFLLLALRYYAQVNGGYGGYQDLASALEGWLAARASSCEPIVAEGVANTFAALSPLQDWGSWQALSRLARCFSDAADYGSVADHAVRGALVWGDTQGLDGLDSFRRTEAWCCNGNPVTAYSAFSGEGFINTEISAQLLLTARVWQDRAGMDVSSLRSELEKLALAGQQSPTNRAGLPYYLGDHGFEDACALPIVDSTIWLLYDSWGFNPFAPGRRAVCGDGPFVALALEGQSEGFPRRFRVGEHPLDPAFPQEINDGPHKQIVIEFTTSSDISQVPITLTLDTVDRDAAWEMRVKLDDGDHCLGVCDRSGVYVGSGEVGALALEGCTRVSLPNVMRHAGHQATTPLAGPSVENNPTTYQLVLEGARGWAVFDWLQLEIPGQVLWTIGNKDDRCAEFDNAGFVYACE